MPIVSVIIPVYKVEEYLTACVTSVLNSTIKDIEVILVDDGSPDRCPLICDRFAELDYRVKVVHKANGGLADARNEGLKIAQGKYIAFVDSDDLIRNDMLEILLKELINANADFIKSDFQSFKDDKEIKLKKTNYSVKLFSPQEAMKDFFYTEYSNIKPMKSTVWDGLYKREMFLQSGKVILEFPEGKINEDTYIFPELILSADTIAHINVALYYYRIRENSITNSNVGLAEIKSCDLWRHIDNIVSKYTCKYTEFCALNSLLRYLKILNRVYHSDYRKSYFEVICKEMLQDREYYTKYLDGTKVRITFQLIKHYPIYLRVKKFIPMIMY